jgi:hypothetical protein
MAGTAGALDYSAWTAPGRTDPWHLWQTVPFDLGVAVVCGGLLLVGSTLPMFNRPRFQLSWANDDQVFERFRLPTKDEVDLVQADSPNDVDVFAKVIRVKESRNRWAENVSVEVININPSPSGSSWEFLPWWADKQDQEFETFAPGRTRFATLSSLVINKKNPLLSRCYTVHDHTGSASVTVAICWEGAILEAITLEIGPMGPGVHFPVMKEIARPSVRSVRKLQGG